jgi:PAS domain-containing protein
MLGFDNFDMETFPQETGNDVDLFLNAPYEPQAMTPAVNPLSQFSPAAWESFEQNDAASPTSQAPVLPVWQQGSGGVPSNKRVHTVPPERETKVKKRKQQHQQKDKERRHRINEGLRQLGTLVQSATGSYAKLDQPTIVTSSIDLISSLQNELNLLRAQLANSDSKGKLVVVEEQKSVVKVEAHGHHEGTCPVFASMAGAGVALIMIRADDLNIVEANSVLANILGYADAVSFVGSPVWDTPLHSRLYQLDRHGRVINDNSNPFAFSEPKVKLEDEYMGTRSDSDSSQIDCLWTARTANGNALSARVTLSVLKGSDSKPTHFLLCSLPSQRSVSPMSVSVPQAIPMQQPEIEVAC